jgi:hypothetical protein
VCLVALSGCASIPKEAPDLSLELGKRLSAIEQSHLVLLAEYFEEKRGAVDRYIDQELIPTYSEETMKDPAVASLWTQVCREGTERDRLEFLRRIGPKIQRRINEQRQAMIAPLEEMERTVADHLRGEYNQARAINGTLTSFLSSAAEVDANRRHYLDVLGVNDEKVDQVISQVDSVVGGLARDVDKLDQAARKADVFRRDLGEALRRARSSFSGK